MQAVLSFLISAIVAVLSVFNFLPTPSKTYEPKKDGILLNAAIISDTHIDYREYFLQAFLANGLDNIEKSSVGVDAVVNTGDLTNYGDPESMSVFFDLMSKHCNNSQWAIAMGNHDVGHVDDDKKDEARSFFISKINSLTGNDIEKIYYSKIINGYRFIMLGDEDDDSWDWPLISDEQLAFLDAELQKSADEGKPVFVVCHWPLAGTNGESVVWDEGDIKYQSNAIKEIVEKYKNVFFISGHLHAGINGQFTTKLFDVSCVETINGVNYINLPTFGLVNRFGIPWSGTGFQMEVYKDQVLFRARNYLTSEWYTNYEFTIDLV